MNHKLEDKKALITLFRELSSHGLYPVESMREWLADCGFNAEIRGTQNELFVFDRVVTRVTGDWGSGVYPLHVLEAVI